jgi:hypothetical protein
MRRRVRRPSYVDPVLDQRARAYAIAHGLTDSAVTEAALKKYLDEGCVDEPLVVGRLDGVTAMVNKIQHDLDVLAVAFGGFVKYSFISAPTATPEGLRRAETVNRAFLQSVSKRLSEGPTFPQEVLEAAPKPRPGPATPSERDGRKGGIGT